MMAIKLETLGERKFKIKLKASTENNDGSKVANPAPPGCNKRKVEAADVGEEQPNKKWKMDSNVKRQCRGVLDALMGHRHGYVFNSPVDPVALMIPDYFTVITHPMDLGTIKAKLSANVYRTTQEFATDVKLTFSNAMLYNPPDNQVHSMAKELECLFLKRWKSLEAKWNHGIVSTPRGVFTHGDRKNGVDANKTSSLNSVPLGFKPPSMSVDEKKKLKEDLIEILVGRITDKLKSEFRKLGLEFPRKEIIDKEFDRFDESVLWQLKSVVKEAKDNGRKTLSTNGNKSNQNSRGSVVAVDGKSKSGASAKSREVATSTSNGETDLKKALSDARAALMKRKSAAAAACMATCDTDSGKPRQEAKANCDTDSGKTQQEAKANCDAASAKALAEHELKNEAQRIEERRARVDVEASKRKVDDENSVLVFKELLKLCGCSISFDPQFGAVLRDYKTGKVLNPLASIGLRLKKDYDDNDFVSGDMEEGEILE